jgi:hypothetical protein
MHHPRSADHPATQQQQLWVQHHPQHAPVGVLAVARLAWVAVLPQQPLLQVLQPLGVDRQAVALAAAAAAATAAAAVTVAITAVA